MATAPTEENHPLLAYFVEDATRGKCHEHIYIEKVRSKNILSGATNLLTEWPSHLTTCWLTTLFFGLAITIVLLFSAVLRPFHHTMLPTCRNLEKRSVANQTAIYIVHTSRQFDETEISALEQMLHEFPNATMEITILHEDSETLNALENHNQTSLTSPIKVSDQSVHTRVKREMLQNKDLRFRRKFFDLGEDSDYNISIGSKKLLTLLMKRRMDLELAKNKTISSTASPIHKISNFEDFLNNHNNVILRNVKVREVFRNTPFQQAYLTFRPEMILFAVRVLRLWDNGGISFQLPVSKESKFVNNPFVELQKKLVDHGNAKIFELINLGYDSFDRLPEGIVTVDEEGLHMETKTSCHAFIGELIRNMRNAEKGTTVPKVIAKTLAAFCKQNAVNSAYCNKKVL